MIYIYFTISIIINVLHYQYYYINYINVDIDL